MKLNLKIVALTATVLGCAACSNTTDLYDEGLVNENKTAQKVDEYKANFIKKYGNIDPNQSWDFSNGEEHYVINSSESQAPAFTRASNYSMSTSSDYYEVEENTMAKMKEVFVEGKNNQSLGSAFAMIVPENDFTIVPIYMGQSGGDFTLYMHVDGIGEIPIWDKWTNMQAEFNGVWENLYEVKKYTSTEWPYYYYKRVSTTSGYNTVNATGVRSNYYTFSGLPKGANMYFYLKITEAASGYNTKGQELGSINNYMREYKFSSSELPSSLPGVSNPEVKIIGCEDASTSKTDLDYNDVVFMIYGEPYVPGSIKVSELDKQVKKRYMIEDLGTSDDTDFNDIVVDVVSTYSIEKTSSSGITTSEKETLKSRKAYIRAMGGTLDFDLKLGNTTWKKSEHFAAGEMLNTSNPDYGKVLASFDLSNDWDPAKNDISVTVYSADGTTSSIGFPNKGTVPMIIAVDPMDNWSTERTPYGYLKYLLTDAE